MGANTRHISIAAHNVSGVDTRIPLDVAGGTNARVKHEVEFDRRADVVPCLWRLDFELLDEAVETLAVIVVDLSEGALDIGHDSVVELYSRGLDLLLLRLCLLLCVDWDGCQAACLLVALQTSLEDGFDEVVGSEDVARL